MAPHWSSAALLICHRVCWVVYFSVSAFPMIRFFMTKVSKRNFYQLVLPGFPLFPSVQHILLNCGAERRNIQPSARLVHSSSSLQSTYLVISLCRETRFQFLVASRCTLVGVLLQQTQTITTERGREGERGRGKTARGAESEWSSQPSGSDGASSLTTNTSPPLVPKQKPHMQTTGKEEPRMAK